MDIYEMQMKENIIPCEIKAKDDYLDAIWNIKQSWTGRVDANVANTFIQEAGQMIINAIAIFEKGYFDCAYYSLRQALELATTMVYLVDIDSEKKKEKFDDWKSQRRFPMDSKMKNYLSQNGYIYADMKRNMNNYFEKVEERRKSYNKYIHKQGFQHFYVSRSNIGYEINVIDEVKVFEKNVIFCIGVVAVMRLAIDPFPILLMDDEMYYRTGDTMTLPFTSEFVEKYIGIDVIKQYKKTDVYRGYYDYFYKKEKAINVVADVIKNQYIDTTKLEEIIKQKHLLSKSDVIAVKIVKTLPEISKVYCYGGIWWYFTNTETKRKK